jgi:dipeptidyl aminopeptidase/acylaminoacyl peptidase
MIFSKLKKQAVLLAAIASACAFSWPADSQRPAPTVARPATPSYSRDVVPILRTACIGCHGEQNAAGGISLTSYMALMKGGKNGAAVLPGKGSESRIVRMMLGTLLPKMPPSGAGLKQSDIDKIRAWIDAGAKVDAVTEIIPRGARRSFVPVKTAKAVSPPPAAIPASKPIRAPAPVTSLAFSSDNKTVAVGTYREVQFWNAETKMLAGTWSGHADAVRSLAYSKDGKWLISGGGAAGTAGEVRVWDVGAGKELRAFGDEHTDSVTSVALNPDATKVATGSADKTVKIWDLATGRRLNTLRDHADAVWAVAWSPDGKFLASAGSDKSIKVWDADTGKRRYSVGAHDDMIVSLEFSPDGSQLVSAAADKSAKVWNFGPDGCALRRGMTHEGPVLNATYGGETRTVVTCSGDKTVKVWTDGNNNLTLKDAKDWVYVARLSPDKKKIVAGAWDGAILFWNAADGKLEATASTLRGH